MYGIDHDHNDLAISAMICFGFYALLRTCERIIGRGKSCMGAQYVVRFVKDKLSRVAVSDAGVRAEALLLQLSAQVSGSLTV